MNKKKVIIIILILILLIIGVTFAVIKLNKKEEKPIRQEEPSTPVAPTEETDLGIGYAEDLEVSLSNDVNLNIIKLANKDATASYLVSPYSIETAFSMLREGANNNTLAEINSAVPERTINTFSSKERISVSNALFIKDEYKKSVEKTFTEALKSKYKVELLYDKFETPEVLNKWVKEKTFGMIEKLKDDMPKDFVLGLANAVAIDVNWNNQFKCEKTSSEEFTLANNKTKNVEMMHSTLESGQYIKTDDEEGIVLKYEKYDKDGNALYGDEDGTQLEFIAIKPTKTNLKRYINDLTSEKLTKLLDNPTEIKTNQEVNLALPRFKYDYDYKNIAKDMQTLGIKDVFDKEKSDLTKIMPRKIEQLYVSEVIHKTHIDLNEKGTKAAAVTYIGVNKATDMRDEKEQIDIKFNKPFLYIIRDTKTKELLFFGTVYNPNEWKGSTCKGEK